ncbi:MAG: VOC family protein [Sedimentisphaerales bacterium]|nr:VOC family protein [Sedimentisphaerales bacterium]
MIIDHIGIVVRSVEKGIEHWEKAFGYRQITNIIENSRQKVKVVFLEKKGSLTVKLIEPVDDTSPIYIFAKKGGGLHHLCFKCNEIESELKRLQSLGMRKLHGPEPGEAFNDNNIAFVYAKQGLNIELIDTDTKAGRLNSKEK